MWERGRDSQEGGTRGPWAKSDDNNEPWFGGLFIRYPLDLICIQYIHTYYIYLQSSLAMIWYRGLLISK